MLAADGKARLLADDVQMAEGPLGEDVCSKVTLSVPVWEV
jgi:hypothetical protein